MDRDGFSLVAIRQCYVSVDGRTPRELWTREAFDDDNGKPIKVTVDGVEWVVHTTTGSTESECESLVRSVLKAA
jgi:hypothetical protein